MRVKMHGIMKELLAMDKHYRSQNGSYNNLKNTHWGKVGTHFIRDAPIAYTDAISEMAERVKTRTGENIPNPRDVSNTICQVTSSSLKPIGFSDFMWLWGKFLENELSLIKFAQPAEIIDIPILVGDIVFKKGGTIPCIRSKYDKSTGLNKGNPRQQLNFQTAFIDASSIYGTDLVRASALRRFDGTGRLKSTTSIHGSLLPYNEAGFTNATPSPKDNPASYFLSGDIRVNEYVFLTALHTIFMREHNRLCLELPRRFPLLAGDDEATYQMARKIVGAIIQTITYNEYLPLLLGEGAIPPYQGYMDNVNPSISNSFAIVAFRLGHSMVANQFQLGRSKNTLPLHQTCFNPRLLNYTSVDLLLEGRLYQQINPLNTQISDDLRNYRLNHSGEEAQSFLDFAALNIQRGRDHGIPDYNTLREAYGLTRIVDFSDITVNHKMQDSLEKLYQSVDNIDPWVGALAEDNIAGSLVGTLNYTILRDQFTRLRDGDRFWFENDPMLKEMRTTLSKLRLSNILRRNTHIRNIPDDVFRTKVFEV